MTVTDRPAPPGGGLPIHPVTGRPVWRGLVIPYIARWTGEVLPDVEKQTVSFMRLNGVEYISYGDLSGLSPDVVAMLAAAQRDGLGLLWHQERDDQGSGEPEFASVHAGRQRQCMIQRRCQVCGGRLPKGEAALFLVTREGVDRGAPLEVVDPPVCDECAPYATAQCPALRARPRVPVRARAVRVTGVVGDLYVPDREQGEIDRRLGKWLHLRDDAELVRLTVAKQLAVELRNYTVEDER